MIDFPFFIVSKSDEARDNVTSENLPESHSDGVNEIKMNSTQFCGNITLNFFTPCKLLECYVKYSFHYFTIIFMLKKFCTKKSFIFNQF